MQAPGSVRKKNLWLDHGESRLFVREVLSEDPAEDPWVLLVHGDTFPSVPEFDLDLRGRSLAEHLASRRICCCLFDRPGYGRSSHPGHPGGQVQRLALERVYTHILTSHGPGSICLMGTGRGCGLVSELLVQTLARVQCVILASPVHPPEIASRWYGLVHALERLSCAGPDERAIRRLVLRGEQEHLDMQAYRVFQRQCTEADHGCTRNLWPPGLLTPRLHPHRIHLPTLVMRGDRDGHCCADAARRLAGAIQAETRLTTLCGLGRRFHLYQGHERAFDAVKDFVLSRSTPV